MKLLHSTQHSVCVRLPIHSELCGAEVVCPGLEQLHNLRQTYPVKHKFHFRVFRLSFREEGDKKRLLSPAPQI